MPEQMVPKQWWSRTLVPILHTGFQESYRYSGSNAFVYIDYCSDVKRSPYQTHAARPGNTIWILRIQFLKKKHQEATWSNKHCYCNCISSKCLLIINASFCPVHLYLGWGNTGIMTCLIALHFQKTVLVLFYRISSFASADHMVSVIVQACHSKPAVPWSPSLYRFPPFWDLLKMSTTS